MFERLKEEMHINSSDDDDEEVQDESQKLLDKSAAQD